jgi:hypothetical protein
VPLQADRAEERTPIVASAHRGGAARSVCISARKHGAYGINACGRRVSWFSSASSGLSTSTNASSVEALPSPPKLSLHVMLDAAASIAGRMLLPLASCFFPRISFSAFFQERSNIKIIVLPMDHLYASCNQEIALCFEKSYVASPPRPWILLMSHVCFLVPRCDNARLLT